MTHGTALWEQPQVNIAFLRSVFKTPEWWKRAACRGKGQARWFTETYSDTRQNPMASHSVRSAKAICASCPVRRECLTEGMSQTIGIWGGTLWDERRWDGSIPLAERIEEILAAMNKQAIDNGLRGDP